MLSCFDQPFRPLDGQLRDAGVTLDVAIVGAGHQLSLRMRPPEIGDLLRALIDQQNDHVHFFVIFRDCVGDMVEKRCLSGARRRDNQAALAHAERSHQIHDPRRITVRDGLKLDPLVRVNGG